MKEYSKKPPIDDLFARKLGSTSLPPSRDGFERLQARMKGAAASEPKLVFWLNPAIQRSLAIAACLLAVFFFGWLYVGSENQTPDESRVAGRQKTSVQKRADKHTHSSQIQPSTEATVSHEVVTPVVVEQQTNERQIAFGEQPVQRPHRESGSNTNHALPLASATSIALVEPIKPVDKKINAEMGGAEPVSPDKGTVPERVADNINKPIPVAERVLVVTIAEPESLVAARQVAKESVEAKPSVNEKPEKETRVANLWQQVKRLKQGEVLARHDDNRDERGLLGRAYEGIKQSFDKEKPAKQ